jgi:hypothetical protein
MKGFLFSQKRGVGFQRVSEYDPSNREAASLHLCHIPLIHWIFFWFLGQASSRKSDIPKLKKSIEFT